MHKASRSKSGITAITEEWRHWSRKWSEFLLTPLWDGHTCLKIWVVKIPLSYTYSKLLRHSIRRLQCPFVEQD